MILLKNSIKKDTIFLTCVQFVTQIISLILNIYINKNLGTENLGLMSLINAFFTFAIIISNGNIFVSSSRFISEEIGKKDGNPGKIFAYSVLFSVILSTVSAFAVTLLSVPVSKSIIKDCNAEGAIKILAVSLPVAALSSCIKGYFNAYRKVTVPALSETLSFLVRSVIMGISAAFLIRKNILSIYTALSLSVICSEVAGIIVLIIYLIKTHPSNTGKPTVSFAKFSAGLVPVMLNSYIPCILSTANDALVPFTLKQAGSSTADALSKYGLFEAVVLPVLFFPSMFISCLSTILVPEISREKAGGNRIRNLKLTEKVIDATVIYSVYIVSILAVYGKTIGSLICGNEYAGKMIMLLAPVVPFIYLEIVLEGIIKGLGRHSFSSLNYLAEYIIRISALLVFTPLTGEYGIAISYYLSNIICNISRIIMISREYGISFDMSRYIVSPAFAAVLSWQTAVMLRKLTHFDALGKIPETAVYAMAVLILYVFFLSVMNSSCRKKVTPRPSPSSVQAASSYGQ